MAERAVFLDRDNTIIENDGYLGVASQVKLLPGAATALSAIRALGYRLIVVSNQSGVARGMFGESDVEAVNQEMCRQLRDQAAAHIDASYYCPYHPDAVIAEYRIDHDWRKPKPGMLRQAAADFNLDLAQCWMIGDQPRDIAAGAAVGTRTILLKDPTASVSEDEPKLQISPNFVVKTLADAARIIAREAKIPQPAPQPTVHAIPQPSPPSVLTPPTTPAATPTPTPVQPVAETLAQRLARQTPPPPPPSPVVPSSSRAEKNLEELLTLLQHQARKSEAPPDFSRLMAAAILVQIFALLALVWGGVGMLTAKVTFKGFDDWVLTDIGYLRSVIYVLVALVLQVFALTLLHFDRER